MADKKTNVASVTPPTAAPASAPIPSVNCNPREGFDVHAPLKWKTANAAEQKMLENLQGNILKGHGRDNTANVFFSFGKDRSKMNRVLRELGNFHVTSAYKQLLATEAFKEKGTDGGTFCSVFISAKGYLELGLNFVPPDGNKAFREEGMRGAASVTALSDPPVSAWESEFQKEMHGMVLVADDDTVRGSAETAKIMRILKDAGCDIIKKQMGKAIKNAQGNGLEHFGYVDGRSQPLMLAEDIEAESRDEGIAHWDPTAKLDRALVADPLAKDPHNLSFGSFFVFRKLEQRVRDFKTKEQELATHLKLTGDDRELAGAMLVGRFEDGTPVTMSSEARGIKAPRNDFDYSADGAGNRCPFHAHIRKTNPRGSGGFNVDFDTEQQHIMARRGITYEDTPREVHPAALPEAKTEEEFRVKVKDLLPEGGVGLLFMAYNSKLDAQFVFTQQSWANGLGFPDTSKAPSPHVPGLDGVIGQPADANGEHIYPSAWDAPLDLNSPATGFNGFVNMRGGEYFFAPSLRFLRGL